MTYSCGMAINFTVSVFRALVSVVLFQTPVFRRLSLTTYEDTENFRFRQSRAGDSWWLADARGWVLGGGCSGVGGVASMPPCPLHRQGLACGWNSGVGVRVRTSCSVRPCVSVKMSWLALPGVRVKTFSAHVVAVFRLVVSGKRFSTHEESRVVFSPFVKILRFDIGDIDLYPIFVKK